MESIKKPPLGVMPKDVWDRKRIQNLSSAINRYLFNRKEIPIEWVKERNKLIELYEEENEWTI